MKVNLKRSPTTLQRGSAWRASAPTRFAVEDTTGKRRARRRLIYGRGAEAGSRNAQSPPVPMRASVCALPHCFFFLFLLGKHGVEE